MALSAGSEFHKGSSSSSEVRSSEQHANEDAPRLCDGQPPRVDALPEGFPDIALEDIPLPPSPPSIPAASILSCENGCQPNKTEIQIPQSGDLSHDEVTKVFPDQDEQRVALTDSIVKETLPSVSTSILCLEGNSPVQPSPANCEDPKGLTATVDVASTSVKISAISQPEPDSGKDLGLISEPVSKSHHPSDSQRIQPKGKKPYLCTECRRRFVERDDLLQHLYDHIAEFTGKHPFRCPKCPGRRFPDMKQHERHHQMGLECDICGEAFHAAIVIAEHRLRVHSRKKTLPCKVCGKKYATSEELTQHQQKRHRRSKSYTCKVCGKDFKSRESLSTHKQTHNEEQPALSSSRSSQHVKKSKEKVDPSTAVESKKISCSKCDLDFSCKEKLAEHKKAAHTSLQEKKSQAGTATSSKQYKCKSCKMDFLTIGNLIEHQQLVHTSQQETIPETVISNTKQFKCKKCAKDFPTRRKLKEHNISVHTSQQKRDPGLELYECKPFKCEKCAMDFPTEEKLKEHSTSAHMDLEEKYPQTNTFLGYMSHKAGVADMFGTSKRHTDEINLNQFNATAEEQNLASTTFSSHEPQRPQDCGLDFPTEEKLCEPSITSHTAVQEESPLAGADSDYEPFNGGSDRDFSDDDQLYDPSMPSFTSPEEENPRACSIFDKLHKCDECGTDFLTEEELGDHNSSAHVAKQEKSSQIAASDNTSETRLKSLETYLSSREKLSLNNTSPRSPHCLSASSNCEPFKCDECGVYFPTKEKLHYHSKFEHKHEKKRQILAPNNGPYRSDILEMDFSSCENLDRIKSEHGSYQKRFPHRDTSCDYNPFPCDDCGIDFSTEEKLHEHKVSTHVNDYKNDSEARNSSFNDKIRSGISKMNFSTKTQFDEPNNSGRSNKHAQPPEFPPLLDHKAYLCDKCGIDLYSEEMLNEHNVKVHKYQNQKDPQTEADSDDEPFKIEVSKSYFSIKDHFHYEFDSPKISTEIGQLKNDQKTAAHCDDEPFKIEVSKTYFSDKKVGEPDTTTLTDQEDQANQFPWFLNHETFKCYDCGMNFSNKDMLNDHKISDHVAQEEVAQIIKKSSDNESQHEASDMEFSDEEENNTPLTFQMEENHLQTSTLPDFECFKCDNCESVFSSEELLEGHKESHIGQLNKDVLTGTSSDHDPLKVKLSEMDCSPKIPFHDLTLPAQANQQIVDPLSPSDKLISDVVETSACSKENFSELSEVATTGQLQTDQQLGTPSDYKPFIWKAVEMYFSSKEKLNECNKPAPMSPPAGPLLSLAPSKYANADTSFTPKENLTDHSKTLHTGQLGINSQIGSSSDYKPYIWKTVEMYFSNKEKVNDHKTSANLAQTSSFSGNRPIMSNESESNISTNIYLNELNRSSCIIQQQQISQAGPSSEHMPSKVHWFEKERERVNNHSKSPHTSQEENLPTCSSSNYRPYICEECGANFPQKQALRDHEMRHKPHKCLHFCVNCLNICDYSSATSAGLTDHMKKYHEVCFECKFSDKWS